MPPLPRLWQRNVDEEERGVPVDHLHDIDVDGCFESPVLLLQLLETPPCFRHRVLGKAEGSIGLSKVSRE